MITKATHKKKPGHQENQVNQGSDNGRGWEIKKLGEIYDVRDGTHDSPKYVKEGYALITSKNLKNGNLNYDNVKYITEQDYTNFNKRSKVDIGDVLFAMIGTIGNPVVVKEEPNFAIKNVALFKVPDNQDSQFLKYYLDSNSVIAQMSMDAKGATQKFVGLDYLRKFPIPLPPLPEQQRIVSILDKAFSATDKAKANAEQNLKNAKELFESYLQGVFENRSWERKTIQDITKVINGYAFASKDFKVTNTIKSVKITNVGVKRFVEVTDNYLPEKFRETLKDFQVREGNIVIALTRTIISAGLKVALVPESYDGALVNQRVAALVPNEELINQNFLYFYLTTSSVEKYVLEHVNALMQPNLSISDLKNMPIPCPPLEIQQTIVRQLDILRAEAQKLEAVYQKKLEDLEELRKSILQKAFSGELSSGEEAGIKNDAVKRKPQKKVSLDE